jgi:hypothetical protein
MKKDDDLLEIAKLYLLRDGKERSRALPSKCYRDPLETIEYEQERIKRQQARKKRKKGRNRK